MPERRIRLRLVVVSPGDVANERDIVENVANELRRSIADHHGFDLHVSRWELDATPGLHTAGAQGLIDPHLDIPSADLVVAVFWSRLGTPAMGTRSGSEHELQVAIRAWREQGKPQVFTYFCRRPTTHRAAIDAEQHWQLLRFREELPKELFLWEYELTTDFEKLIREHLTKWILGQTAQIGEPFLKARVHRAYFNTDPREFYFINLANLFPSRTVEVTHVWYEDETHHIPVLRSSRQLPIRLDVPQSWETWIEVAALPEAHRENAFEMFRARTSEGFVFRSERNASVPPIGAVPGGPIEEI